MDMGITEEVKGIARELENVKRRLNILREQEATFGINVPPYVRIDREDAEKKVIELEGKLQQLQAAMTKNTMNDYELSLPVKLDKLTTDQRDELHKILIKFPSMKKTIDRDNVVNRIGDPIADQINRDQRVTIDVYHMIETCTHYPGGIGKLILAVKKFDGETVEWSGLEEWINKL